LNETITELNQFDREKGEPTDLLYIITKLGVCIKNIRSEIEKTSELTPPLKVALIYLTYCDRLYNLGVLLLLKKFKHMLQTLGASQDIIDAIQDEREELKLLIPPDEPESEPDPSLLDVDFLVSKDVLLSLSKYMNNIYVLLNCVALTSGGGAAGGGAAGGGAAGGGAVIIPFGESFKATLLNVSHNIGRNFEEYKQRSICYASTIVLPIDVHRYLTEEYKDQLFKTVKRNKYNKLTGKTCKTFNSEESTQELFEERQAPSPFGAPGPFGAPSPFGSPGPFGAPQAPLPFGAPGPFGAPQAPSPFGSPGPFGAPQALDRCSCHTIQDISIYCEPCPCDSPAPPLSRNLVAFPRRIKVPKSREIDEFTSFWGNIIKRFYLSDNNVDTTVSFWRMLDYCRNIPYGTQFVTDRSPDTVFSINEYDPQRDVFLVLMVNSGRVIELPRHEVIPYIHDEQVVVEQVVGERILIVRKGLQYVGTIVAYISEGHLYEVSIGRPGEEKFKLYRISVKLGIDGINEYKKQSESLAGIDFGDSKRLEHRVEDAVPGGAAESSMSEDRGAGDVGAELEFHFKIGDKVRIQFESDEPEEDGVILNIVDGRYQIQTDKNNYYKVSDTYLVSHIVTRRGGSTHRKHIVKIGNRPKTIHRRMNTHKTRRSTNGR
jgi:hypothetical protein